MVISLVCAASLSRAEDVKQQTLKPAMKTVSRRKPGAAKPRIAKPALKPPSRSGRSIPAIGAGVAARRIPGPGAADGRARALHRPVPVRVPPPMLSNIRHHGPNPAAITGFAKPAGIDGRQVHRRP